MITQTLCLSYLQEILEGVHEDTDTYKIALYTNAATLDKNTTAYSGTDEVPNGSGYTTGGETLSGFAASIDGDAAKIVFDDVSWPAASFTARGALIYNSTKANRAVCVKDFGSDKTVSGGTFTVDFNTVLPNPPIYLELA